MRINIENAVRHMDVSDEGRFVLEELIKHLKMVRDEFAEGNWGIVGEFFDLYRFGDNQTSEGEGLDLTGDAIDKFVRRFAKTLEELELTRERRAEALKVAEERREEIYGLKEAAKAAEEKAETYATDWYESKAQFGRRTKEMRDQIRDLKDENLRQKAVIEELDKIAVSSMLRQGISGTHEDCPKCKTRGFTNGAACEECGGIGRRRLKEPVRMDLPEPTWTATGKGGEDAEG